MRTERETNRFAAISDDETIYEIVEYTTFIESVTSMGTSEGEGLKRLVTTNGESVNRVERGVYDVGHRKIRVKSDNLKAP